MLFVERVRTGRWPEKQLERTAAVAPAATASSPSTVAAGLPVLRHELWGGPMRTAADAVTARALRHGLEPEQTIRSAARDLARLARGNRRILEQAHRRIERGIGERPSTVGLRARAMLAHALELASTDRTCAVLVEALAAERSRDVA